VEHHQPGPYQLQAAIQAVHCKAPTSAQTDWPEILGLYDRLLELSPSPMIELNRAVALAEIEGPAAALSVVDRLPLERAQVFHAIRADLLRRLGRTDDAAKAYDEALARAENAREREFLRRSRDALTASRSSATPRCG